MGFHQIRFWLYAVCCIQHTLAAYFIAEVTVTELEGYDTYRVQVPPTIEKYGGRVVTRAAKVVGLEGSDASERLVIIEFDDMAALKRWYQSDDVKPLNELISTGINQNPWAHFRRPIDMIFQG